MHRRRGRQRSEDRMVQQAAWAVRLSIVVGRCTHGAGPPDPRRGTRTVPEKSCQPLDDSRIMAPDFCRRQPAVCLRDAGPEVRHSGSDGEVFEWQRICVSGFVIGGSASVLRPRVCSRSTDIVHVPRERSDEEVGEAIAVTADPHDCKRTAARRQQQAPCARLIGVMGEIHGSGNQGRDRGRLVG